jgi:hypothetical protein
MLIADLYIDSLPARVVPPRLDILRVWGMAAALIVHAGLLLFLLLPAKPTIPTMATRVEPTPVTAGLVWIEAEPLPKPIAAYSPRLIAPHVPQATQRRYRPALIERKPSSKTMIAEFIAPPVDARDLFGDIEAAAAEIVALDPRLPNAGMPSALGQVPGRAEPFIHLPLTHQEGGSLKRLLQNIGKHMIVGGLPEDPLRTMAERSWGGRDEPICNDPENPLADERCWTAPDD